VSVGVVSAAVVSVGVGLGVDEAGTVAAGGVVVAVVAEEDVPEGVDDAAAGADDTGAEEARDPVLRLTGAVVREAVVELAAAAWCAGVTAVVRTGDVVAAVAVAVAECDGFAAAVTALEDPVTDPVEASSRR
jgi:hypothetical protein